METICDGCELEGFGEFVGERATRRGVAIFAAAFPAITAAGGAKAVSCGAWRCGSGLRGFAVFALGRLGGIGAQEAIFKGSAIKTLDDGGHFVGGGRLYESKAFGFLGFVVADYFYGIGDEVFGSEPLLNIVGSDPRGQVA